RPRRYSGAHDVLSWSHNWPLAGYRHSFYRLLFPRSRILRKFSVFQLRRAIIAQIKRAPAFCEDPFGRLERSAFLLERFARGASAAAVRMSEGAVHRDTAGGGGARRADLTIAVIGAGAIFLADGFGDVGQQILGQVLGRGNDTEVFGHLGGKGVMVLVQTVERFWSFRQETLGLALNRACEDGIILGQLGLLCRQATS